MWNTECFWEHYRECSREHYREIQIKLKVTTSSSAARTASIWIIPYCLTSSQKNFNNKAPQVLCRSIPVLHYPCCFSLLSGFVFYFTLKIHYFLFCSQVLVETAVGFSFVVALYTLKKIIILLLILDTFQINSPSTFSRYHLFYIRAFLLVSGGLFLTMNIFLGSEFPKTECPFNWSLPKAKLKPKIWGVL